MDSPARSPPFSDYFGSPPESFRFYDQQPEIGRGAYGSVHPGELNGRPVAVKRIHTLLLEAYSRDEYIVKSFEAECRRMQSLNHPRLVTFLGAYKDAGGPFLVMERMLQDLRHFLDQNRGKLTLQNQVQLCLDIATGLHYLHSQDTPLVHRDLNDKNILIDKDGRASIADLGQSRLKKKPWEYFATQAPGAMVFMPPEALSKTPHYNEMMDIFSFGVLMLEIATQREPNPGLQGIARDQEEDRRKEDLDCLPEGHPLKQLILDCLQNDPHKRPHIEKLCHELQQLAKVRTRFAIFIILELNRPNLSVYLDGCTIVIIARSHGNMGFPWGFVAVKFLDMFHNINSSIKIHISVQEYSRRSVFDGQLLNMVFPTKAYISTGGRHVRKPLKPKITLFTWPFESASVCSCEHLNQFQNHFRMVKMVSKLVYSLRSKLRNPRHRNHFGRVIK